MFDDSHEPFFHLKNLLKDARLIQGAAAELGVPLPATLSNAEILALATGAGFGEQNQTAVHAWLMSCIEGGAGG